MHVFYSSLHYITKIPTFLLLSIVGIASFYCTKSAYYTHRWEVYSVIFILAIYVSYFVSIP